MTTKTAPRIRIPGSERQPLPGAAATGPVWNEGPKSALQPLPKGAKAASASARTAAADV